MDLRRFVDTPRYVLEGFGLDPVRRQSAVRFSLPLMPGDPDLASRALSVSACRGSRADGVHCRRCAGACAAACSGAVRSWTLGTTFWNWQAPKGQLFGGSGLGGPTTQATVVAGPDCAVAYHFAPVARGLMNQRLSPLGDVQRHCPGAVIFRSTSNSMVAGHACTLVP